MSDHAPPVDASDVVSAAPGVFPIVAVGASAGGLAPTVDLLRELGPRPEIAVVVIHHLDPAQESALVEILSRATPLAVAFATDGVRLEPNHVYVLRPNAGLRIYAGILSVFPRVDRGGLHLPINHFFESLALDQESLAVGVVLSGTGLDGTHGIKAIKSHGGITLAQDTTAQYASMPESAIATGCVDFILPPPGLARELVRLGANAPSTRRAAQSGDAERDYVQILAAVRNANGVDFASYKHTTIRRRLERRLFLRGITELGAYLDLLKRDPNEVSALCEDLLIHVTSFFREPEAFEALRTQVLPKLLEARTEDPPTLRVWVPGFSIVDGKNKIYARSAAAPRLAFDFTTPRLPFDFAARGGGASGPSGPALGRGSSGASDVHREADRLVLARFAPPGVVATDDLAVVQFRGHTGPFLEHVPGVATLDLLRLAREELRLPLRRAIDGVRTTQAAVTEANLPILVGEQRRTVTLEVIPFAVHPEQRRFFLVLFRDCTASEDATRAPPGPPPPSRFARATTTFGVSSRPRASTWSPWSSRERRPTSS